ncbi:exonuclease domain-containing protein [Erwinia sp. MYb416]|uniref:exonuclease domain-containing protein n=1 Tax=Erwinia sp. MYb416 TaxID=3108532 RepID=UPI0030AF305B
MPMSESNELNTLSSRFRGFYPVVIDVETAGFDAKTNALLEIAAVTLKMNDDGWLEKDETIHFHVEPFVGSVLQPEALAFNGIDPENPLRGAVSEHEALHAIFKLVRKGIKESGCSRAIMVAHNATFDLNFMNAAAERASLKRNPFHPFVTFDTFDNAQAHSALYDTLQTADLFCELVNRWKRLGGWPLPVDAESDDSEE